MKQVESDFREVRNNSQAREQAAAQIGAVGRMADELFASGALKDSKFGSQSKCPSASEVKKCFHPDKGKGKDSEDSMDSDNDEDLDGYGEDENDEDLDGDEEGDGDIKEGKGKPQPNYCKDGNQINENEKGELKKNFDGNDPSGAVGDGSGRGEPKNDFMNDRPSPGDSGNGDNNPDNYFPTTPDPSGNGDNNPDNHWASFGGNDHFLPSSLDMYSPYDR